MEHAAAISQFIVPILLGALCVISGGIWRCINRIIENNERDHEHIFSKLNNHDQRITRVETRLEAHDEN